MLGFNAKPVLYWAAALMMAFHVFFGAIVVERMAGLAFGGHEALFAFRMFCLLIVAGALLVVSEWDDAGSMPFAWMLFLIAILGLLVGAWRGHVSSQMVSHFVQAATAIVGFVAGGLFARRDLSLMPLLRWASIAILISVAMWLALFVGSVLMRGMAIPHYSLNFYGLVIPFAYFLAARNGWGAVLTLAMMVVVGKRALILAALAIVVWAYIAAMRRDGAETKITALQWVTMALVAAFPFVWPSLAEIMNVPEAVVDAGRYTDISDLNELSSFRGDLVASVVRMMNEDWSQWWTGAGFGSSFVFKYGTASGVTYGVDLMPLHFAMIYGVPVMLVVIGFIALVMIKGWISVHRGAGPDRLALVALLVGYMACSMLTYVSIDPTLWFFLGIAAWWFGREGEIAAAPSHGQVIPS